jgi:UDP-2,3-diacylglucosamine pyrophosphatase LpxH
MNNSDIFIIGDIHGYWDTIFSRINLIDLKDCTLIGVGDLGIGFVDSAKQERQFKHLNDFFSSRNINFIGIRGNHDDPSYFNGDVKYSHFTLLPDYTTMTLNDKEFMFVGGAVSVDRIRRKDGVSYWKDEIFILDQSKIKRCDVLITHSAPTWNGPFDKVGIETYLSADETLWKECVEERKAHDILIKLCGAKKHYCGHFHKYYLTEHEGCVSRILEEHEIILSTI